MVFGKTFETAGVVEKDVGIEDEIFSESRGRDESKLAGLLFGQLRRRIPRRNGERGTFGFKNLDLRSVGSLHSWLMEGRNVEKGLSVAGIELFSHEKEFFLE